MMKGFIFMTNINYVNTLLINRRVPLDALLREIIFLLISVMPIYEFVNGERTDKIIGFVYECVDTMDFNRYRIKIEGQKAPLMSNEKLQQLRENGEKVAVEFINATIMAYVNEKKCSIEDTVKADGIKLVSTEE